MSPSERSTAADSTWSFSSRSRQRLPRFIEFGINSSCFWMNSKLLSRSVFVEEEWAAAQVFSSLMNVFLVYRPQLSKTQTCLHSLKWSIQLHVNFLSIDYVTNCSTSMWVHTVSKFLRIRSENRMMNLQPLTKWTPALVDGIRWFDHCHYD